MPGAMPAAIETHRVHPQSRIRQEGAQATCAWYLLDSRTTNHTFPRVYVSPEVHETRFHRNFDHEAFVSSLTCASRFPPTRSEFRIVGACEARWGRARTQPGASDPVGTGLEPIARRRPRRALTAASRTTTH